MKTVFHVISSLNVGGAERQLLLLLLELEKTSHNEVVCLIGRGIIGQALSARGIRVHYLDGYKRVDGRIMWRLWRLLRDKRPDIVVTYLIFADIVGRLAARLAGVRVVIESHRSSLFGPRWWHQVDRLTRWLVTHYTVQTNSTRKLLHEVIKVPMSRMTVIPNAVAEAQIASPTNERLVISCVANLRPEKDLGTLLGAFAAVAPDFPMAKLWLVGEGLQRKQLEEQVVSLRMGSRVRFWGLRPDVPTVLARSTIFVLPTRIEGMSNALLEALAAGLPCIVSDIPANREVIDDGCTGLLFAAGQKDNLAQTLRRLLAQPLLREQLGRAARNYARQRHAVPVIAQQWHDLLNRLG